ncbi:hypothetical protein FAEPRAM212_02668 [Faecalibacterium prausnitzii M21/2]|uniref:Uncharacterized protein n=1 Tax=Faecalibacterium prausnitzii M21/2 TaxID=411485 RepID=A8SF62_9FIRM|nr:hypothetical protein FAEPRAM212_02668 [Faecalibacterium prausnitzii M21/2]
MGCSNFSYKSHTYFTSYLHFAIIFSLFLQSIRTA